MTEKEAVLAFVEKVRQYYNQPRYVERREPHTYISHLFWVMDKLAADTSISELEDEVQSHIILEDN